MINTAKQLTAQTQRGRYVIRTMREGFSLDTGATLECTDGDKGEGPIALYAQAIPYTDFPLPTVTLWCVDGVIMLPSEY